MYWDARVYFSSDRDGTMNIWSMGTDGANLKQHTFHKGWDVKRPSLGQGRIVYELGADLRVFEVSTREDRLIPIKLASDFDQTRDRWIKKPMSWLTSWDISPDGDRVVLTSRGRIAIAPAKDGRLVEVTRNQGVRYRDAAFAPNGKQVRFLSDASGEFEFWSSAANGVGRATPLTKASTVYNFSGVQSADGKWIAYANRDKKLHVHNVETGETKEIASSDTRGFHFGMSWSPDSRWLAYSVNNDVTLSQIWIYDTKSDKQRIVTSPRIESWEPAWGAKGKWLYFMSDRHFVSAVRSPWGSHQPDPFFERTTKLYALALQKSSCRSSCLHTNLNRKSLTKNRTRRKRRRKMKTLW
jgi:tricorn protease